MLVRKSVSERAMMAGIGAALRAADAAVASVALALAIGCSEHVHDAAIARNVRAALIGARHAVVLPGELGL